MVLNEEKGEVLVVQDRQLYKIGQKRKAVWKFPGGLSDEGENLEETAIREVYEETGVKSEFKSVMMFRQQHQMKNAFDKSDIYIICRMSPLSYGISHCEDEIARCEWMKLSTLITHADTGPITRLAARLAVYGMKNGFQNVDLEPNRMRSWVDPNKTVCLYHRYLPS
ncbi:unnamed protein product [Porites evermanni]|uniref:Nudix hydrolase domain-containing protein n=1 Tax=Porites evermanni TaxID=104178 RepID=A0ABN8PGC1_9CNID|nr:unnamed protein product [Porites evermanni]